MPGKETLIFFMLTFLLGSILMDNESSLEYARLLRTDLLTNYSKYVRPVYDQSSAVYVGVQLSVIAIQEFDEVLERFSIAGAFFVHWSDVNMIWSEEDYGGIQSVFMGYKEVWVPEIILVNPSEKLQSYGKEWQLIKYRSTGIATWIPADLIKATCSVNVLYFPFDTQECKLNIYTWGYSAGEVKLISLREDVDISSLAKHGTWNVVNTSVKTEDDNFVSKISFMFKLERKPQYVIVNVMLPIMFLSVLNVLVFFLPAESGERVSYAITVLLSIAVFMTIVSDILPKSSEPVPLIAYFLMIDLIISALISVSTIFNLRIYHKKSSVPVPKWLLHIYHIFRCDFRRNAVIGSYGAENSDGHAQLHVTEPKDNVMHDKKSYAVKNQTRDKMEKFSIDKESFSSETSPQQRRPVTWQNFSAFLDCVFMIIFSMCTVVSFVIFIIITQVQSN